MKQNTLISLFLTSVFALSVATTPSYALTSATIQHMQERASASATRQADDLMRIISRGDNLIAMRLTSLQNLATRVNNDQRLSSDEKATFLSDINTTTTNLQNLKTKLDADTDPTTALSDAKAIITSYRIYEIFEPKERYLIVIDNLQTASGNIATLITQIQNLLNTLKGEGKDTTISQAALTDASTQITSINTLLAADNSLIMGISINTTNPISVFSQVTKDLVTVRSDIVKIRTDFQTIQTNVRSLLSSSTATSSATEK